MRVRGAHALNAEDMRQRARRLPRAVFDAIDGGAGDELTLRANRRAFERIWFRPRALADVSARSLATTVMGQPVSMPVLLAPCGMARMANSRAELAAAAAAGKAGTIFAVSGASSYTLEEIAQQACGPLWYQLYLPPERAAAETLLARARRAGYDVLCVTIDNPLAPRRERDVRNRLTIPLKLTPRLLLTGLGNPLWARDFVLGNVGRGEGHGNYRTAMTAVRRLADVVTHLKSVTRDDVAWLRERWPGKLVLKGVGRGDEVDEMVALGVDGVIVSNHGGRNLDGIRATIDILPEVVAAAGGRIEVLVDGGFRRGGDVVKALALGARACLVGRPYMFGLAVGGEQGIARVLEIFRTEIEQTIGLLGCPDVNLLDRRYVAIGDVP